MKTTDTFKQTIQSYLESRAQSDELFAVAFKKEGKNIDDCITYILKTVQKSGCNGFTDDEVYSMAVHYYDEDKIEVGKPIQTNVIVNHKVELTAEEIREAKENAIKQVQEEAYQKMHRKPEPVKKAKKTVFVQQSLFQ